MCPSAVECGRNLPYASALRQLVGCQRDCARIQLDGCVDVTSAFSVPAYPSIAVPGYYFQFAIGPSGTPSITSTMLITQC